MIQRHLFDAGNVIEYDSDEWRNCPRKKRNSLVVHELKIDGKIVFNVANFSNQVDIL